MKNQAFRRKIKLMSVALLALSMILSACGMKTEDSDSVSAAEGKIQVVTTIAQIAEPMSVIGGDKVEVISLMGPGVDPHLYNATQGDIKKLQDSDIVLFSGLHLEGNMGEIFEQISKTKPAVAIAEAIPEAELLHDETGAVDPHVWFDLKLWKQALERATQELITHTPEHADYFNANKDQYFEQLDDVHKESAEKMASIPADKRVLVTAHDAFGYFGRAYEMKVVGLQGLSTEDEIGISDIDTTIQLLLEHQIPAVFVESSINKNSINAVIEGASAKGLQVKLGGELYSDAMGEAGTTEGTYIGMYRHNIETIYHALTGKGE